jgi:hypothetical protein
MTPRGGPAVPALALLFLSPWVDATPGAASRVSLEVTQKRGANGCPSEKALRQDVTSILGYAPFDAHAARRVRAVLSAREGGLQARIELLEVRTGHRLGLRELSAAGPSCAELGAAVALAIALAIDPLAQPPASRLAQGRTPFVSTEAASTTSPPVPAPAGRPVARAPPLGAPDAGPPLVDADAAPPDGGVEMAPGKEAAEAAPADAGTAALVVEAPPAPLVVVPAPPPSCEPPTEPPPFHFLVGAGGDWTLGLVPRSAFGVLVHGGLVWRFAQVELEARFLPSTSLAFESGTISSSLVTGTLVGCGSLGDFSACGLFQAGALSSTGSGYVQSQSATNWEVALGARLQWSWVFAHPLGVRVQVDGLVNLVRTRLLVGPDVAWHAPSFGFAAGAGVFLVF